MLALLAVHVFVALTIAVIGRRLGRGAFLVGAVGPASVLAWVATRADGVLGGDVHVVDITWVDGLDLGLVFRVDAYALLFLAVIGVAGPAIFWHAGSTMEPNRRTLRFAALMTAFSGAMTGLVMSDHLMTLFVFWEATTVISYLLIGHADHTAKARAAALHAILITGAGGLALLAGLILLADQSGSWLLAELGPLPPSPQTTAGWVLVLLGAATKSAQFPFHGWLPGAMAAPTAASAFLHSATMVKAGILLVGRLAPVATTTESWWSGSVAAIGLVTMVVGGWAALRQTDLKLLLAHGTVSQLGLLFLLVGYGDPGLTFAGLAMVAAHALFKASLFLTVGTIDVMAGTRDLRRLTSIGAAAPLLMAAGIVAGLSMAGGPGTAGFVAKEAAVEALLDRTWLLLAVVVASVLTVTYSARFVLGAFGPPASGEDPAKPERPAHPALVLAPLTLAAVGLGLGLVPAPLASVVDAATAAVGAEGEGKLVAWPGLVAALGWSGVSLLGGALAVLRWGEVERIQRFIRRATARLPTATQAFDAALTGSIRLADRITGSVQSGSLPTYAAVIISVAVTTPTVAALMESPMIDRPASPRLHTLVLALLVGAAAVGAARARRRFTSVLFLGGVGYGVAGLYAATGGPDLVLTQVLVETLAIGLFALVIRHLPAQYVPSTPGRWRAVVASAVAAFVLAGGLLVGSGPAADPVSTEYVARAEPEAAGRNVVNVILVDFRGFDTLGEIAVVAVATLGAAGLVMPVLRNRRSES